MRARTAPGSIGIRAIEPRSRPCAQLTSRPAHAPPHTTRSPIHIDVRRAGIFNLSGWIGHNGSLPGYQAVVVHRPEANQTMVILINTDIEYQGAEPGTTLATAVTKVISPDHVYLLNPQVQEPDETPTPTTTKPR